MATEDMDNYVFVFGSNLKGIHGRGAAKVARDVLHFPSGKGEGFHRHKTSKMKAYALPTKKAPRVFMSKNEVLSGVQNFMKFAYDNPELTFKITKVGCGLGGHKNSTIAPMFEFCAYDGSNCMFDTVWKEYLPDSARFWGTF